jgi:multiple sugar transport system permease protein
MATAPIARRRRIPRDALTGWLFALPILLYFAVWVIGPILGSLALTFVDWNGLQPLERARFVGLGNVERLARDTQFIGSFRNTIAYALITVSAGVVCGLMLALALNTVARFVGLIRAIYFAPVVLPMTAMALLWGLMYQPAYGLFNEMLEAVGLPRSQWIFGTESALLSVCLLVFWKSLGWYMVIFLAGLKAIPEEIYEASKIDGAGPWVRFWRVTLPLLKPTTLFVLVVSFIGGLQVFSPVYVMTRGGPAGATDTVVYRMYFTAFEGAQFSYATSMAIALFALILVVTLAQMRIFRDGGLTSHYS